MEHKLYPHLFSPIKINNMMLKNRIIAAPLGSYTDKSLSGIAMIVRGTSGSVDDSRARMRPGKYYFEDKMEASRIMEEISVIHQRGAKAEFEMCHVGQFGYVEKGDYAIGPVSFTREDGVEVRAMDEAMMEDIAEKYAKKMPRNMGLMLLCCTLPMDGCLSNFYRLFIIREQTAMEAALKIEFGFLCAL